jgi:hypothetical protein
MLPPTSISEAFLADHVLDGRGFVHNSGNIDMLQVVMVTDDAEAVSELRELQGPNVANDVEKAGMSLWHHSF